MQSSPASCWDDQGGKASTVLTSVFSVGLIWRVVITVTECFWRKCPPFSKQIVLIVGLGSFILEENCKILRQRQIFKLSPKISEGKTANRKILQIPWCLISLIWSPGLLSEEPLLGKLFQRIFLGALEFIMDYLSASSHFSRVGFSQKKRDVMVASFSPKPYPATRILVPVILSVP